MLNKIQESLQKELHARAKWSLFQECKACSVFQKSSNVTPPHSQAREEESHSTLRRRAFAKIQHNKHSQRDRTRRELPQPEKEHLEKKQTYHYSPDTGKKAKMSPESHSR